MERFIKRSDLLNNINMFEYLLINSKENNINFEIKYINDIEDLFKIEEDEFIEVVYSFKLSVMGYLVVTYTTEEYKIWSMEEYEI